MFQGSQWSETKGSLVLIISCFENQICRLPIGKSFEFAPGSGLLILCESSVAVVVLVLAVPAAGAGALVPGFLLIAVVTLLAAAPHAIDVAPLEHLRVLIAI
jgi:hypothetical protein